VYIKTKNCYGGGGGGGDDDDTRAVFFQPPIVLLRKYEMRGSQICASRDCAAPPPQPLPLSAPIHQS
jgi:hypothetical protein